MKKLFLAFIAVTTACLAYASPDARKQDVIKALRILKAIRNISDTMLIMGLGVTAAACLNEPTYTALATAIAYAYHVSSVCVATRIVIYGYQWQLGSADTADARAHP